MNADINYRLILEMHGFVSIDITFYFSFNIFPGEHGGKEYPAALTYLLFC